MESEETKEKLAKMQSTKLELMRLGIRNELVLDKIFMVAGEHAVEAVEWLKLADHRLYRKLESEVQYNCIPSFCYGMAAAELLQVLLVGFINAYGMEKGSRVLKPSQTMQAIQRTLAMADISSPNTDNPEKFAAIIHGAKVALPHLHAYAAVQECA